MATTGIVNGTDLLVYVGGTAITHSTSCTFSVNHSTREATTKDSSGYKEVLEGLRDWSVDADGMTALDATEGFEELYDAWVNRTALTVKFGTAASGDQVYSGTAYITSLSVDAGTEESSTFSVSLEGTGSITTSTNA